LTVIPVEKETPALNSGDVEIVHSKLPRYIGILLKLFKRRKGKFKMT